MIYTISVPDRDDSVALATIGNVSCRIRFRWNDIEEFWDFGIYDVDMNPVFIGIKMVPNYPLNLSTGSDLFSDGYFYVMTKEERLNRDSFKAGFAVFCFGVKE